MELSKLIALLNDIKGQQELHERAKTGEEQAVKDFVRFAVLRGIQMNDEIPRDKKIKTYEEIMGAINLEVVAQEAVKRIEEDGR